MLRTMMNLITSMLTVAKHLLIKPVTLEYPEKKNITTKNFRGTPIVKNCIKCGTCTKVCPSNAIKIIENELHIDLKKCIFCGNCAYYCPRNAIIMSNKYENAVYNKNDLNLLYKIDEED